MPPLLDCPAEGLRASAGAPLGAALHDQTLEVLPARQALSLTRAPRGFDGRFYGPRGDLESVPRLPTFPARWVLDDPRGRPYMVFWQDLPRVPPEPVVTPFTAFATLVTEPLAIDREGYIQVPDRRGLGVELDEPVIARYTTRD